MVGQEKRHLTESISLAYRYPYSSLRVRVGIFALSGVKPQESKACMEIIDSEISCLGSVRMVPMEWQDVAGRGAMWSYVVPYGPTSTPLRRIEGGGPSLPD